MNQVFALQFAFACRVIAISYTTLSNTDDSLALLPA